jgi:hypothetical protein
MLKNEIIDFYRRTPKLELPHQIPGADDVSVVSLAVNCKLCDRSIEEIHGTAVDHASCSDFVMTVHCPGCHCITQGRVRYYADGRMLHLSDEGWNECGPQRTPWWRKLWPF